MLPPIPPRTKRMCVTCGLPCAADWEVCPRCGTVFASDNYTLPVFTHELPITASLALDVFATFPNRLVFVIKGQPLPLPEQRDLVIGRCTMESNATQPDVDLTPFGAVEKGVSRTHLKLRATPYLVYLSDLNSTNGTWLNGRRVIGERLLRDGDRLQLGRLALIVRLRQPRTLQTPAV